MLVECLFIFVNTYKPIAMTTEPSQFSLIPRVIQLHMLQCSCKKWGGSSLIMRQSVIYTMTATIVVSVVREANRMAAETIKKED